MKPIRELFIAGYDFSPYRKPKIGATERHRYNEPLVICKDVPYALMITIRWHERSSNDFSMPVWVDGFSGVISSTEYLGPIYRLYAKNYSNVQIISGSQLYIAQKISIILLGDGYGMETP